MTPNSSRGNRRSVRLSVEALESRRPLAITVGSIGDISIDEGDTANITSIPFFDSTRGNGYSSSVTWEPGSVSATASVVPPTFGTSPLTYRISYAFDTQNFFASSERREALEFAIDQIVSRLNDPLAGFGTGNGNTVNAVFTHPGTGTTQTVNNFSIGNDELLFYVGGRPLDNAIAEGGRGGHSAQGSPAFLDLVNSRGQFGANDSDVAMWGGAITFDTDTNWHFGLSADDIGRNQNDFISVAMHETIHVLGFAESQPSFNRFIRNGEFTGPNAVAAYDQPGSPPLGTADQSHWQSGLTDNGAPTLMAPALRRGERILPTELDFAAMRDIGWQIGIGNAPGSVTASHTYADSGNFVAVLQVRDNVDSANETFNVRVQNIAPTIDKVDADGGLVGQPVQLNTDFTDPGADTHTVTIDWGDGTTTNQTVLFGARSLVSTHVYLSAGEFDIELTIDDGDGGTDSISGTAVVSQPRLDWQNPTNPLDVDNDGSVAPRDALVVINEVQLRAVSDENGNLPPAPANVTFYYDTDGDDRVAPIDALVVINALPNSALSSQAVAPNSIAVDIALAQHVEAPQLERPIWDPLEGLFDDEAIA